MIYFAVKHFCMWRTTNFYNNAMAAAVLAWFNMKMGKKAEDFSHHKMKFLLH